MTLIAMMALDVAMMPVHSKKLFILPLLCFYIALHVCLFLKALPVL